MKVFVDTSALLAILDQDDIRHDEAAAAFRAIVGTAELVTHNYIHVEAGALVERRLGATALTALVERLLPVMTTMWIDEDVHAAAVDARRGRSGGPSLVDEVSFVLMRRAGIEVALAYDAEFDARGFRRPVGEGAANDRRLSEDRAVSAADAPTTAPTAIELVSVAEIAARSGRPTNTIQSWRRRHPDFPAPFARLAAGPVWRWPDVDRWMASRSRRARRGQLPVGAVGQPHSPG